MPQREALRDYLSDAIELELDRERQLSTRLMRALQSLARGARYNDGHTIAIDRRTLEAALSLCRIEPQIPQKETAPVSPPGPPHVAP